MRRFDLSTVVQVVGRQLLEEERIDLYENVWGVSVFHHSPF